MGRQECPVCHASTQDYCNNCLIALNPISNILPVSHTDFKHPLEILVLFGSQTGYAQEVAERITREARKMLFTVTLSSFDDCEVEDFINQSLVICVCSTTGQGDIPQNIHVCKHACANLKELLEVYHAEKPSFRLTTRHELCLFWSGYNYAGKKLFKRMLLLGAVPLIGRGDGDDQHYLGVDGALNPWLELLWQTLLTKYPLPAGQHIIQNDRPNPTFSFNRNISGISAQSPHAPPLSLSVNTNKRITPTQHFQDVRHFEFRIIENDVSYNPGDILIIKPKNLPDEVQEFIDFFGWQGIADEKFLVVSTTAGVATPKHWHGIMSVRKLLEEHLDIFGKPRRYLFELLSHFSENDEHTRKLKEFSSAAGQDDLFNYCHRVRRTTFEVLQDFHSCRDFPIEFILDLFHEIKPRSFSIASSPTADPKIVQLLVAVVDYNTSLKKPRSGVCTKWMASLAHGDVIHCTFAKGTFTLPPPNSSIIMIGPGTGLAPMRSILHWRVSSKQTKNILIFGGRNKSADFFYKQELDSMQANGSVKVISAFSRDQADKIYVQHQMLDHGLEIWDVIGPLQDGYVYLSGNAKRMPDDVAVCLVDIIEKYGKMARSDAQAYLDTMVKKERFQKECW